MFLEKKSILKCVAYDNFEVKQVISTIEQGGLKIALIINSQDKLVGTVNDGDIRRGLLSGYTLDSPILEIIRKNCLTATINSSKTEIIRIMKENAVSQIPIISEDKKLIGLEISEDLIPSSSKRYLPNHALLMAGGRGKRLMPITNDCPKPLLPINGKPILEIILEQCIDSGIRNFYISVYYLAEKIKNYFGDGSKWNVKIDYIEENKPLGTAGPLKLLPEEFNEPIIIINGDVLTRTNFQDVLKYHSINSADITIGVREHKLESPFGVIEVDGISFKSILEKPSIKQLVNAGIYVVDPSIVKFIKSDEYLDMPDLILSCKKNSKNIIVYPIHEFWLDIGKPEALDRAHFEWRNNIFYP